jgi:hypothetical protein
MAPSGIFFSNPWEGKEINKDAIYFQGLEKGNLHLQKESMMRSRMKLEIPLNLSKLSEKQMWS